MPRLLLEEDGLVDFGPITGEIPSPIAPPPGCCFHPRCQIAVGRCREEDPRLRPIEDSQQAACHLAE